MVSLSLEVLSRHGGLSAPHWDGRDIAWYNERDLPGLTDSPTWREGGARPIVKTVAPMG
jgi:hypothetical protein